MDDDEQISLDYLNRSNARIAVLESYAELGAEGVEKIIPFLEDEDSWVVSRAINALEKLGPAAAPAVPGLMKNFAADASNREAIIRVVTEMGPTAEAALPGLVSMLHDESLKLSILEALVAIDQELDQDAYYLLVPVLGDSSPWDKTGPNSSRKRRKRRQYLVAGLETGNEKPKMNVLPFWPP